ncbi:MAG: hypothetical protein B7Z37_18120 [Verrucomicrobia bacterium 12-59-8]|nr:MAG: hypothetical protein B7Z37_18120 [Verrucomicrobia bacterium 12-59-8]
MPPRWKFAVISGNLQMNIETTSILGAALDHMAITTDADRAKREGWQHENAEPRVLRVHVTVSTLITN